jgi:tripeptidyl-peptidase I
MAGFVSLVNSARAKIGKPPIGFLNKMLYDVGTKNTSIYNDVTEGHNKCCAAQGNKDPICCNTGFSSTPGWDPVVSRAIFRHLYCCCRRFDDSSPRD